MLSTLGPNGAATLREAPDRLKEVNEEVEALGVRILEQYALLGQYDFLNIIEAPDEVTMTKLAIALASRGTMKSVTLPAVPIDDFIARLKE